MRDLFSVSPKVPGFPCAFSPDRRFRYVLWRAWECRSNPWEPLRYVMVIGLNPSTADESNDDPTIRRCIGYARDWGFDALCMTNLFAYRATDPGEMKAQDDPVGAENNTWLRTLANNAGFILAAWGADGSHLNRDRYVRTLLAHCDLHVLGLTKQGLPRHPLYMPRAAKPMLYGAA